MISVAVNRRSDDSNQKVPRLNVVAIAILLGGILLGLVRFMDRASSWTAHGTITPLLAAERTVTADTVPVNVDAVLFWMVHDAQRAALEVQDYAQAVSWAAQTALRDILGRAPLADLLRGR